MEKGLISIDRWGDGSKAYFLTHLHADHTCGLSSRWCHGPLFCSPISARLLPYRFPGFDVSLLNVLDIGVTKTIFLFSDRTASQVEIHVTPIDAHHCPGAVMYLFRGDLGCVLHTGDFRWELESESAQLGWKTLHDALGGERVDTVYLDNTYCHPSFSFPPRIVAAEKVVKIIKGHPAHEVIIGVDMIGKEDLLIHISKALNTKIWVWPERLQTMRLLGLKDMFTTQTSLTRVRAVPRYSLTLRTLDELNSVFPTIGIMPTGLPWYAEKFNGDGTKCVSDVTALSHGTQLFLQKTGKGYTYSVPYSVHSCFSELYSFLNALRPLNVVGIVSSSFCYVNPQHHFSHLFGAKNPCSREYENSSKRQPRKNKKATFRNVRSKRVHALRRGKCGAKIEEINDAVVPC